MLLARYALPEIPALAAVEKWKATSVALPLGDAVIGVFGARTTATTVVRWAPGAEPLVREYPDVGFGDSKDVSRREKAGDFDASSDVYSRLLATRPHQLLAATGQLWLVRDNGHARLDPETLEIFPVARSQVKWLAALPGGDVLAGSGAEYSGVAEFQRLQRCPAALIDQPIFRTRTGLSKNPDWVLLGQSFPAGEPESALVAGVRKASGGQSTYFHAAGAAVVGGDLIVSGGDMVRAGTSRPALAAIDLEKAEVTRWARLPKDEEPLVPIATAGVLLGVEAKQIVRLDPAALAIVDRAELPAGVRIIGHDATRLVAVHKRSKSLLVLDAAAFAGPLADAVAGIAAALVKSKAKARA
jgi:hypothetical protein